MKKERKVLKKLLWGVAGIVVLLGIAYFVYIQDYYRAEEAAIRAFCQGDITVSVETWDNDYIVFAPEEVTAGFIFYPGGKVEYTAYAPLMWELAEQGILCVLVEMPGNLAVLDMDAAKGVPEQFPEIEEWYIGGHSLGGSMAASYIVGKEEYAGLVLLGSYSTAELKDTGLEVLSIYGSEDKVMNREKYEEYHGNLPQDTIEIILEGGCHAGFGMYGAQEGDGVPVLTAEEQIRETAELVAKMITEE
ncbi:MAG: alpha/beta hydrolase [Lachnospiraceae bacterium]|nr:alpha/beta hydrolase [Lachnospiraceae bacterium]